MSVGLTQSRPQGMFAEMEPVQKYITTVCDQSGHPLLWIPPGPSHPPFFLVSGVWGQQSVTGKDAW